VRTLTLVTPGFGLPDDRELRLLEEQDQTPRGSLYPRALNSDLLDEKYLERSTGFRKFIYGILPLWLAQITEAYIRRKEYDAVISWSEQLGITFAAMLKLTDTRVPHVALMYSISKPTKAWPRTNSHKPVKNLQNVF
jgi:hypothetical protein